MDVDLSKSSGTVVALENEVIEAQSWMADCEGYEAGYYPPAADAIRYVQREYPGGWFAFVAECCTFVQL